MRRSGDGCCVCTDGMRCSEATLREAALPFVRVLKDQRPPFPVSLEGRWGWGGNLRPPERGIEPGGRP